MINSFTANGVVWDFNEYTRAGLSQSQVCRAKCQTRWHTLFCQHLLSGNTVCIAIEALKAAFVNLQNSYANVLAGDIKGTNDKADFHTAGLDYSEGNSFVSDTKCYLNLKRVLRIRSLLLCKIPLFRQALLSGNLPIDILCFLVVWHYGRILGPGHIRSKIPWLKEARTTVILFIKVLFFRWIVLCISKVWDFISIFDTIVT